MSDHQRTLKLINDLSLRHPDQHMCLSNIDANPKCLSTPGTGAKTESTARRGRRPEEKPEGSRTWADQVEFEESEQCSDVTSNLQIIGRKGTLLLKDLLSSLLGATEKIIMVSCFDGFDLNFVNEFDRVVAHTTASYAKSFVRCSHHIIITKCWDNSTSVSRAVTSSQRSGLTTIMVVAHWDHPTCRSGFKSFCMQSNNTASAAIKRTCGHLDYGETSSLNSWGTGVGVFLMSGLFKWKVLLPMEKFNAFHEIAETVNSTLRCIYRVESEVLCLPYNQIGRLRERDTTYYMIGCEEAECLPPRYIMMQFEQLQARLPFVSMAVRQKFDKVARGAVAVLDYNKNNLKYLPHDCNKYYIPFGIHHSMAYPKCLRNHIKHPPVIFFGNIFGRRQSVLQQIQDQLGSALAIYDALWNKFTFPFACNKMLAVMASKISFCVPAHDNANLETVRINFLVYNGVLVVSPKCHGWQQYADIVIFVDDESSIGQCVQWCLKNQHFVDVWTCNARKKLIEKFDYEEHLKGFLRREKLLLTI